MEKHAIQLEHVGLSKIEFTGYRSGSGEHHVSENAVEVSFSYSPYQEGSNRITLIGEAIIGELLESPSTELIDANPFYLHLRLHGFFSIDADDFDVAFADDFASKNAPFLMYPFLREQVYSLAIRCGFPNVMIPLVKIPRKESNDPSHEV